MFNIVLIIMLIIKASGTASSTSPLCLFVKNEHFLHLILYGEIATGNCRLNH